MYRNGYVVANLNAKGKAYDAWPLKDLLYNKEAELLTNMLDDKWFCKYDMQEIIPDLDFAKMYLNYCRSINLPAKLLLFESLDNTIIVENEVNIKEVMGFDCIGTVHYSYLQSEIDSFKAKMAHKNICLSKYGLANSIEDVIQFINDRRTLIAAGVNLEDFWSEMPVKISIIDI